MPSLCIGAFIVLVALIVLGWLNANKRLMGSVTVENISTHDSFTKQWNRGQAKLLGFNLGDTGFDIRKSYFQASGKRYVKFISNKPFVSDNMFGKAKKIQIESGMEVTIYSDEERTKGIRVYFSSFLDNPMI